jgi:hypothetical protein
MMSNPEAGQEAQKLMSEKTLKRAPIPRQVSRLRRGLETGLLVAR